MENFYYIIGSIVSTCAVFATVINIANKMYYSKTEGYVLSERIEEIKRILEREFNK